MILHFFYSPLIHGSSTVRFLTKIAKSVFLIKHVQLYSVSSSAPYCCSSQLLMSREFGFYPPVIPYVRLKLHVSVLQKVLTNRELWFAIWLQNPKNQKSFCGCVRASWWGFHFSEYLGIPFCRLKMNLVKRGKSFSVPLYKILKKYGAYE